MGLTHKLTNTTRTWNHDAREKHWKPTHYAMGQEEQNLYLGELGNYTILYATGENITTQPVVLTAGSWRIEAPDYRGEIYVHRLQDGIYAVGEHTEPIGNIHSHGDILTLEGGRYIVESETRIGSFIFVPQTEELTPHDTHETFIVEEPIGFDKFQMEMKRHDLHGIGAELSSGTLEFYGLAADIIEQQYNTDIDLDVTYEVQQEATTVYSGKVDLSTVSIKEGDYKSVSARVGEIGVKTTFNNRVETDIDLNVPKTVDGEELESPTWKNLHIPLKHLPFTNQSKQNVNNVISASGNSDEGVLIDTDQNCIFIPIGDSDSVKFGEFSQVDVPYSVSPVDLEYVDPQYVSNEEFVEQFGNNVFAQIDIEVHFVIQFATTQRLFTYSSAPQWAKTRFKVEARMLYNHDEEIEEDVITGRLYDMQPYDKTEYPPSPDDDPDDVRYDFSKMECRAKLKGSLLANGSIKYYLVAQTYGYYSAAKPLTVLHGSYVEMTVFDTLTDSAPVYADMILAHDALNVVAQAISEEELTVKSDWYRTPDSKWNSGTIGGGATKALTNGYHIRELFTTDEFERNMPVSFKTLIESLAAIDCVGWGFSNESGDLCVRVERWDWFYKDTVVLNLTDVAEVTTEVYTDRIPTELTIGYKKYATVEQYNAIDSPHGIRTFTSGLKAVSKTLSKQSEFIADNYAIEETRRAKLQKSDTESTTYDENIFVFELVRNSSTGAYLIGHTATNATNVGREEEFINAKLSPRHMAARWRNFIFSTNNPTPFRFTSGEINYKASFGCKGATYTEGGVTFNSLQPFSLTSPQAEDADITYIHTKFKAEKITFTYPLTLSQYNAVKANPYGLIGVNGKYGWIMDFKYELTTGSANFTLIAKN